MRTAMFLKHKKPHIVHVQFGPHGDVYGGMFGEPMLLLLLILRVMGLRTTVTLHSTWMLSQVRNRIRSYRRLGWFSSLAIPFFKAYMKALDRGTDTVQLSTVRIDSHLRRMFLAEYGWKPDKVLEIPHPCRTNMQRLNREESLNGLGLAGRQVILMFGFVRRGKGIEMAIRAMENVARNQPNATLLVAGMPTDRDGEAYLKEARDLVEAKHLQDHVRFDSDFIPDSSVPLYFSAARILLIPSTESVGASGPMHSQSGFGLPIVSSDVGLHSRQALGGNPVLFKNGDHQGLARTLLILLKNEELAAKTGERIREYALREGWDVAAKRTLDNYVRTLQLPSTKSHSSSK
jgi:glycosyltransferase involved in cell wall biosynthesis